MPFAPFIKWSWWKQSNLAYVHVLKNKILWDTPVKLTQKGIDSQVQNILTLDVTKEQTLRMILKITLYPKYFNTIISFCWSRLYKLRIQWFSSDRALNYNDCVGHICSLSYSPHLSSHDTFFSITFVFKENYSLLGQSNQSS